MKADIHPESHMCKVSCSCGNVFDVISENAEMTVEICASCHPYYTGQQKFIDSAGRVDKYTQRYNLTSDKLQNIASAKDKKKKGNERIAHKINPKKKKLAPGVPEKKPGQDAAAKGKTDDKAKGKTDDKAKSEG